VGNSAITKLGGCGACALSVGVGKLVDGSYMGAAERWKLVPISELRRLMRSCLLSRALAVWTWPEGPLLLLRPSCCLPNISIQRTSDILILFSWLVILKIDESAGQLKLSKHQRKQSSRRVLNEDN